MRGTLSLPRASMRRDQITLQVEVAEGLPQVQCRQQQIQQVVMNLLTNARDALKERYPKRDPEKRIIVIAELVEHDGQECVRTTVEDSGRGIPMHWLFRPFLDIGGVNRRY